jgi:DNA polymerase elongation subunit (family B)
VARMFQRRVVKEDSRVDWVPHPVYLQGVTRNGAQVLSLYEFGIDPLLRFFHDRNIQPASWIRINKRDLKKTDEVKTNTNFVRKVQYDSIHSLKDPPGEIPWVIASFDIECLSSHGSFPQPIKDWKKPARDLVESLAKKKWTRKELRAFLHVWFLDDIPNGPTKPNGFMIDGIFTKEDKKPTSG